MYATPETIGQLLARGEGVRVGCTSCKSGRKVDLAKLVEAMGPDFSLFNKRAKCRLMRGCPGYNRFFTTSAFGKKLYDEATEDRWIHEDWVQRMGEMRAQTGTFATNHE